MLTNVLATAKLINEKVSPNLKICILKTLVKSDQFFMYLYIYIYIFIEILHVIKMALHISRRNDGLFNI